MPVNQLSGQALIFTTCTQSCKLVFIGGVRLCKKTIDENKPMLISIGYSACHCCHETGEF
jgi:hypothetical protein